MQPIIALYFESENELKIYNFVETLFIFVVKHSKEKDHCYIVDAF